MGLRKTSADSLSTLHGLEECASFSNPFSGRNSSSQGAWGAPREHASKENRVGSRPRPVNPWSDVVPIQAKSGSLRGVQRGSSAAMDILRSSPQEYLMGELAPHRLCTAVFLVFKADHELGPHRLCRALLIVFKAERRCHRQAPPGSIRGRSQHAQSGKRLLAPAQGSRMRCQRPLPC